MRVYPHWKWKSHVEDYEFIPIKNAFECRDEAKLQGTYSSDEGDDDSTVENMKKGSGRIPKYDFIFELEDMPTSEVNSNEKESLAMQLEELENIHGNISILLQMTDDGDMPSLMSDKSSEDSIDQEGRQRGRDMEGRQLQDEVGDESGKDIEGRQ